MRLFDKFCIEELIGDVQNYNIACKYDTYDNVETICIERCDESTFFVEACVNVLGNDYSCTFQYDSHYQLKNYRCACGYCTSKSPCAHIGAVLWKLNQLTIDHYPFHYAKPALKEQRKQREKSRHLRDVAREMHLQAQRRHQIAVSHGLIYHHKQLYQKRIDAFLENECYEITPYFHKEIMAYYLDFKIGNEKKYVIKNIGDFLRNCEQERSVRYGNALTFVHRKQAFNAFAQQQIQFMHIANKRCQEKKREQDYFYRYDEKTYVLGRYIDLDAYTIDDFYETYHDYAFDNLSFREQKQPISLHLRKEADHYVLELGEDDYFLGMKQVYRLCEENCHFTLIKYEFDEQGACFDLLARLKKENNRIVILEEDFADFYKYVLTSLKEHLLIPDLAEQRENDYDTIKIYGDVNEQGQIYFQVIYVNESHAHIPAFQKQFPTTYAQELVEQCLLAAGTLDRKNHLVYLDENRQQTYTFLQEGLTFLKEYAQIYISDVLKRIGKPVSYHMNIGVRMENNLLALDVESSEIPKMEVAAVLEQYRRKKKFYRLRNGDLLYLESTQLAELSNLLDRYHLHPKDMRDGTIHLAQNRAFSLMNEEDLHTIQLKRKASYEQWLTHFEQRASDFSLSPHYQKLLRDYQKEGYQWLRTLYEYGFNGILADDMGLGKTLQVIALLDELQLEKPSIVVCPSSLLYNWEEEVHRFAKQLPVTCITGNQQQRMALIETAKTGLLVTSYDYLRRDFTYYGDLTFGYVILDESQYIKNPKTKNAFAVKQLKAEHKLALSGTPIENALAELWSVFDFLMPQYLFSYAYFQKNFESKIIKEQKKETNKRLQKLVSPFILRRNKKAVLSELPDKVEKTWLIPFSQEESKLYYANLAQVNQELQVLLQSEKQDSIAILALLMRLRQICCEPRMIYEGIDAVSSKMKACLELLLNHRENGQKVLLFSSFTKVFDLLEEELRLNNITYFRLSGDTPKEKRKELVRKFQDGEADVFLISLKAGGTGLNLTKAEAVIHFDPWWNSSAQNQASDRAYRIGQHKNVQVHQLIMKNSIEEKIQKLQEKKKELADLFVEQSSGSIASLSKEELLALFTQEM